MKNRKSLQWAGIILVAFLFIGSCSTLKNFYNREADLRTEFEMKMEKRTAFYDKMWKTIAQKSQIALKNDSSFQKNVNVIMEGRKDAGDVFMKWVQESNPNANYDQVSALYQDLSRSVEAQRDGFFIVETEIMGVVQEHTRYLRRFPNNIYAKMFHRGFLQYDPITSSRTDNVIETGKDDDIKVF
jgi:hypothetical protein